MRTIKFITGVRNIFFSVLTIIVMASFASCARKETFLTSAVVPAARGDVKIKRDHNRNYIIQIKITNLAEVGRLQPAKHAYIVWMISDQNVIKNIGQINSSTGSFTENLKATFETVSSSKPVKIFISAEDDVSAQSPGMQVVLSTDQF
ncbi:MAG: hypothetical protein WDM71_02565 [Ferruginibacter sp.]